MACFRPEIYAGSVVVISAKLISRNPHFIENYWGVFNPRGRMQKFLMSA